MHCLLKISFVHHFLLNVLLSFFSAICLVIFKLSRLEFVESSRSLLLKEIRKFIKCAHTMMLEGKK